MTIESKQGIQPHHQQRFRNGSALPANRPIFHA